MPVDRGDLGSAPGGRVHDGGVPRSRRIVDGPLPQRRPAAEYVAPEGHVGEPGQLDGSSLLARREPDREVETHGPADLVAQEPAERAAVHPTNHFADEMPVEERVLAEVLARWPLRLLSCEGSAQSVPVVEGLGRQRIIQRHDAGLVTQHLTNCGRRDELGPVGLDRLVEPHESAVDQHQQAHRGERFRDGVGHHEAVGTPRTTTRGVGIAAVQIGDPALVVPRGHRGAGAGLLRHDLAEGIPSRLEPGSDLALDPRHRSSASCA